MALGRVGYGLALVLAFSGGLALVLTLIGLLCIYAGRLFAAFSFEPRLPALVPLLSALVISLTGLLLLLDALRQVGVV